MLGIGCVLFGLVETGVAIANESSIGFFWFPALVGGGAAILLGMFKVTRPDWVAKSLVIAGALAGALATVWTILVPILAVTLIVLTLRATAVDESLAQGHAA